VNTADRVTQLRGRVQGVDRAFDYVVRTCEAWKLAANDASVHERLGRSYATNTFLVIRQALRRELAMGIARLWDSNRRTDNLFSIANTLEDQRVLTALVAEYREYWLRPYDYPLEEFSVEDALAIQKGLVEESDLRIPNMRGIMMARKKPLTVVEGVDAANETASVKFEKPAPKGAVKLVSPDNLDELVSLLHNEAKVI